MENDATSVPKTHEDLEEISTEIFPKIFSVCAEISEHYALNIQDVAALLIHPLVIIQMLKGRPEDLAELSTAITKGIQKNYDHILTQAAFLEKLILTKGADDERLN